MYDAAEAAELEDRISLRSGNSKKTSGNEVEDRVSVSVRDVEDDADSTTPLLEGEEFATYGTTSAVMTPAPDADLDLSLNPGTLTHDEGE